RAARGVGAARGAHLAARGRPRGAGGRARRAPGDLHAPAVGPHHRARVRRRRAGAGLRGGRPRAGGRVLQRRGRAPRARARAGGGLTMGTTLAIAAFELRTKLTRISTFVYFFVFAALAALWMAAAGGAFASTTIVFSTDKVYINSPYALSQTVTILGLLGMVTVAAFMGRAVQQDFEYQ